MSKPVIDPAVEETEPAADEAFTAREAFTAEVSAQILSRPQRLVDVGIAGIAPAGVISEEEAHREIAAITETLASLALANPAEIPSKSLRDRILKTLAARARPAKRALLVIDMLNDHLTPGRPLEVPRAREIVTALATRLDAARKDRTPIVYVCDAHAPDDSDFEQWSVHNVRGSEGAEVWPALAPQSGDRMVHKPTYSGFSRSDLADVLAELGVDTLVLTGCSTEVGLFATASDALQRGYAIEIPRDAQAGLSEATEQMTLGVLALMPPYGPARADLLARVAAIA